MRCVLCATRYKRTPAAKVGHLSGIITNLRVYTYNEPSILHL